MAWRQIGDKPLSEPMLTRFTDEYIAALGGEELQKDKTVMSLSYLYNSNSYISKMAYLYWKNPISLLIFRGPF